MVEEVEDVRVEIVEVAKIGRSRIGRRRCWPFLSACEREMPLIARPCAYLEKSALKKMRESLKRAKKPLAFLARSG